MTAEKTRALTSLNVDSTGITRNYSASSGPQRNSAIVTSTIYGLEQKAALNDYIGGCSE